VIATSVTSQNEKKERERERERERKEHWYTVVLTAMQKQI
jgi:hypothetical protein